MSRSAANRILLVEDDQRIRTELLDVLRAAGFDAPQPFFRALDYHGLASRRS